MKLLITGAAGFLGKECIKLFNLSDFEIITTDVDGNVDLVGDLSNSTFVDSLPEVDVVINCAAVQYVSKNIPLFNRKRYFYKNNILSAKNLESRFNDGKTHFIHIGTSMMYRQTGLSCYSINSPMGGDGVYSESKLMAQSYINKIAGSATVIPCIIGGEGREGLFRGFVNMITKFGMVFIPGRGEHKIHMVHVEDVAALIFQIAKVRASGLFNAAAPDPLSIRQWIEEIKDELHIERVVLISIPLFPLKWFSRLLGYRLLAREQLLMLQQPHVLSVNESTSIGWIPKYSNAKIARDIAGYISRGRDI